MIRVDLVGWSLMLIALAMAYSVFIKAGRAESKSLKSIGYVIGIIIVAGCLILAILDVGARIRIKKGAAIGPRRTTGLTTAKPIATPKANVPVPRLPRSAAETAPVIPNIPAPPAEPKAQ
ncbi:MAG: hypothetical protein PHI59_01450 [Candidatus Omnitrophica bacterium]|nr:hypothetical protein [Candidatus Omnitrophota bacterium]